MKHTKLSLTQFVGIEANILKYSSNFLFVCKGLSVNMYAPIFPNIRVILDGVVRQLFHHVNQGRFR